MEKLSDLDRMALEVANLKGQLALAEAKKAELNYKITILHLYVKYGLSETDAFNEAGDIIRAGASKENVENKE